LTRLTVAHSFAGVSGEAIVVTLIVAFISRFVKDRTLVLVGMIFSGAALVWMIIGTTIGASMRQN